MIKDENIIRIFDVLVSCFTLKVFPLSYLVSDTFHIIIYHSSIFCMYYLYYIIIYKIHITL